MNATKTAVSAALAALMLVAATGCSTAAIHKAAANIAHAESDKGLAKYVEAERATIPTVYKSYPGVYSDVTVEGSRKTITDQQGIPDGTYSVVVYTYVFAGDKNWAKLAPALEGQKSLIDQACKTKIFPGMRAAGVIGPMSAQYYYGDKSNGTKWSYACTTQK